MFLCAEDTTSNPVRWERRVLKREQLETGWGGHLDAMERPLGSVIRHRVQESC